MTLPVEGEAGTVVEHDFYAEWAPAKGCPVDPNGTKRTTMGTDALRTAFRGAVQAAGTERVWQLATYPDEETSHRAYLALYDAIDRCTTGAQSDRHPLSDLGADEAFVKRFNRPAGAYGDRADGHNTFVVARVGPALVAHALHEKDVPIRDPLAPTEPAVTAVRDFLASLCDRHGWCHT